MGERDRGIFNVLSEETQVGEQSRFSAEIRTGCTSEVLPLERTCSVLPMVVAAAAAVV
jgi:hypothetical protein